MRLLTLAFLLTTINAHASYFFCGTHYEGIPVGNGQYAAAYIKGDIENQTLSDVDIKYDVFESYSLIRPLVAIDSRVEKAISNKLIANNNGGTYLAFENLKAADSASLYLSNQGIKEADTSRTYFGLLKVQLNEQIKNIQMRCQFAK